MTLSCERQWQKRTYGPGIYINEATISDVLDISGETLPYLDRPYDIGIKLTLDIGRGFQPELTIGGNFRRDVDTNEVTGWGSAFTVAEALSRFGYNSELSADNTIPPDVLQSLVGKQFLRLSYVSGTKQNGKLRYSDWSQIATLDEGAESLAERFRRSLAKGYPRNYRPQVLDGSVTEPATPAEAF